MHLLIEHAENNLEFMRFLLLTFISSIGCNIHQTFELQMLSVAIFPSTIFPSQTRGEKYIKFYLYILHLWLRPVYDSFRSSS